MQLTFYGGARSVTGANYLLEIDSIRILIDCGMFQGSKYSEDLNYDKFSYDPTRVDFVIITHSHTDHAGRLPKLYKEGFRGKVLATNPTVDLMRKALADNLNLIKQEAKEDGHEPLFTIEDLSSVLSLAGGVDYEKKINLSGGVNVTFHDAGHILGSAIVEVVYGQETIDSGHRPLVVGNSRKLYFTGDLGNPPTPLLRDPYFPSDGDYIVVESAYGSRVHEDRNERKNILKDIIKETIAKSGTLMIPSFAMERTQELLYELNGLIEDNKIPRIPIFVDSPLATNLTEVYKKYPDYFNKEASYLIDSGDDIFNFPGLKFTHTVEESKKINDIKGAKVIIAGSGMSNGGRILHHEKRYLPDYNSAILFVGYQVKDSLGRKILDGEKEVKIFGEKVAVNCKVEAIGGYSAHADQDMLLKWVKSAAEGGKLKKVFIVQGEEDSSLSLARKIERELRVNAIVPKQGESFEL